MFEIEPILCLQSFASPALTWLLRAISQLGYTPVYIALVMTAAFGLRLRPGLAVVVALLLGGVLTESLKNGLALPRPDDLDSRVLEPFGDLRSPVVDGGGARAFWALPAADAIAAVRARGEGSYGFPSGHVSAATAFFLGVAFFFRSRGGLLFAGLWIPLMALSRMYLGRHFLADILGGAAVGGLVVVAAAFLLRGLEAERTPQPGIWALAPLAVVSLVLLILTPLVRVLDPENVGRLAGLLVAYAVVLAPGLPSDHGTLRQRAARVMTAVILYVATSWLIGRVSDAMGCWDSPVGSLVEAALLTAVTLAGTVAISRRARWYVVS